MIGKGSRSNITGMVSRTHPLRLRESDETLNGFGTLARRQVYRCFVDQGYPEIDWVEGDETW